MVIALLIATAGAFRSYPAHSNTREKNFVRRDITTAATRSRERGE